MSAATELTAYGYEPDGQGSYIRSKAGTPRDMYTETPGGFLRFTRVDGQWEGVPYTIAPSFEGVSGLTYATHPQCFEMVYPDAYLENIYRVGNAERSKN